MSEWPFVAIALYTILKRSFLPCIDSASLVKMGLSIADFDVSITPSFSKAGKTASSSAVIRNVVKMAIASKNSEIKRQQKDLGRGRSFQGSPFNAQDYLLFECVTLFCGISY